MASTFYDISDWARALISPKKPEPSYPRLPEVRDSGESNIEGLYLMGEVAGTPLIKLGLNDGVRIVEALHEQLKEPSDDPEMLDFLIVGAGASGLGAAMKAHELGHRYVVIESDRVAQTVVNMYKGKVLFAEPENVPNRSSFWFEECTRERLLEKWHAQIEETGLNIHEHEKVTNITRRGDHFDVETEQGAYKARRVLMGVGKAGNPRKAGVPGEQEHAARVHHTLGDPDTIRGQKLFVYGGGDVACEAVLALKDHNDVTMVTIDETFIYPKKRNADAIKAAARKGELKLHMASHLVSIGQGSVVFKDAQGDEHTLENDAVYEMIGAVLPMGFFKRVGIRLEQTWDLQKWIVLALVFIGVYSLYALKAYPKPLYSWPFNHIFPQGGTHPVFSESGFYNGLESLFYVCFFPFKFLFTNEAFAEIMKTHWFQQGYLYSFAYTVIMGVFGWHALKRWAGIARNPTYQTYRYISLIAFQVVFFLIANIVAVQALSIQHAWRAWGLYQPWPLFFNTFNWWSDSDPRAVFYFFIAMGLFGTFVAIPWASRNHGKRFCTWVCGCGGLAETLGDRWRHLSAKGKRSRAWEFQGVLILVAAFIVTLICVGAYNTSGSNIWWKSYSYIVDFWLVAVIPIALYPFFGGKVWCRYWCPLAAYNGLLAGWYGKLKIRANDKCITCTLCSKYCQVGVDVMAFAKNQDHFDNSNSACIQCGICIDVCPMDVLYFDTSDDTPHINKAALEMTH